MGDEGEVGVATIVLDGVERRWVGIREEEDEGL